LPISPIIRPAKAARLLGISRATLYRWESSGRLAPRVIHRFGPPWRRFFHLRLEAQAMAARRAEGPGQRGGPGRGYYPKSGADLLSLPKEIVFPRSEESERAVLGAVLLRPGDLDSVARSLCPDDFCDERNQVLYQAFLDLAREGTEIDLRTTQAILEQRGQLESVGGLTYLTGLELDLPDIGRLPTYAAIVKDRSVSRRSLQVMGETVRNIGDGGQPAQALESLRTRLGKLADELPAQSSALRFESLEEFAALPEEVAEPLIGTPEDCVLPAGGMLLMYGDGGAGKTTLSMDALVHLASGSPWLGLPVSRPLRIVVIENEGPRGPLRAVLKRKLDSWEGADFAGNICMLVEPWARFTLSEARHRRDLAERVNTFEADVVMLGPLASIGAKGGGTPDDINEFLELVTSLRSLCRRPFALWIIHHENRSGKVSGAWERVPDTLLHVQAQGNGRTRLHWQKVRWSSELHDAAWNLAWNGTGGFLREESAKARDYGSELLEAFQDGKWHPLTQAAEMIGAHPNKVRPILSALVESGVLAYAEGPQGFKGNAKCYRLSACTAAPDRHVQAEIQGCSGGLPVRLSSP
jgi:hypothetical protein